MITGTISYILVLSSYQLSTAKLLDNPCSSLEGLMMCSLLFFYFVFLRSRSFFIKQLHENFCKHSGFLWHWVCNSVAPVDDKRG